MHIKNWLLPSRKKRSQEPLWDYWNEDPQQEDTTRGRSSSRRSRRKDREELSNHFVSLPSLIPICLRCFFPPKANVGNVS